MTKPNPFIIESLDFNGEQKHRFEGNFLSQISHLGGKESAYYYFRNTGELQDLMKLFGRSGYRYLHLSCHGGKRAIDTTLELIPFAKLVDIINPYLDQKRLFVSACSVVNEELARRIIPESECLSIIGPAKDVRFNEAAIVWAWFPIWPKDRSAHTVLHVHSVWVRHSPQLKASSHALCYLSRTLFRRL